MVPWCSCGRRGSVAGPLVFLWLPWGRGGCPGLPVAAMGAWGVPWCACGRRGGVTCLLVSLRVS